MALLDHMTLRVALRIVVPALAILIGTVATVVISLNGMADEVNQIEETLTEESTQAAIRATLRKIGDSNRDYAEWDDAVRNLYGTVDSGFVTENFPTGTETGIFFDTAYLLDEDGRDVFAYRNGEPIDVPSAEAFGPALSHLIGDLPANGRTSDVRTGLVSGKWGVAAVSVGPVVPTSADFPNRPTRARFLVLAKDFGAATLKRLGEDFLIDDLRFADTSAGTMKIDLVDPTGRVIGAVTWSPRQVGSEAHTLIVPVVLIMLALLSASMAYLIVVALRALREIRKREAQARHVASHDSLTRLPNRLALVESLDEAMAAKRAGSGSAVAVTYLDLDGFKEVNDAYGHETGDQLLKEVALRFRTAADDQLLARVGGDEFVVLVVGTHAAKHAGDIGWRIIRSLAEPFDIGGRVIVVGTSVGVAVADIIDPSAEELLRRADVAMYQAKQQGPNRLFVYDAVIDTARHERLEIADELRRALKNDDLDLAYQPVFDAASRQVVGAEALLRWNRPHFGPLMPGTFVPIAEETGLIDELGAWTLRRACRDARNWDDIRISVNVSPAQFRNPSFESLVALILEETGFPARRLELEVTESYFVVHPNQARKAIDAIRALGVTVALDDFGTGYSSIGYLRSFTFDKLKLDRSMIAGIVADPRAQRLVQAAIALADALDLEVTAEGVELEEEAMLLRLAGCNAFQGFFFARPESAGELSERLRAVRKGGLEPSLARSA